MVSFTKDIYDGFFQVFADSVKDTLVNSLDEDTCDKIEMVFESYQETRNANGEKDNSAIYKIDCVVGHRQGKVAILVQEDLIAAISDILTGGDGVGVYKGALTEIETNSVSAITTAIFGDLETAFRGTFEEELVFGTSFSTTLKEKSEYASCFEGYNFNFVVNATLNLTESSSFKIKLLLNDSFLEAVMQSLGYSESGATARKKERTKVDLECLEDIDIKITAELGQTQIPIKCALELTNGSVVELDTQNNADIKVYANGLEFAYAQIVAVDDSFGIKITKIITPEERLENMK